MGARTSGREAALQMLFALESGGHSADRVIGDFWREFPGDPEGREYSERVVRAIAHVSSELDATIAEASAHWRLERMTAVDRNILRVGTWELRTLRDVPRAVIIDEAVDLAKRYGSETSGSFVNGVLDRVADLCGRSADDADHVGEAN